MAQAGRVQTLAIVVDRHGAIDDFVLAVAIDVGHAEVMISLALVCAVAGRRAIEQPALSQLAAVPVIRREHGFGIIAASHEDARMDTVKVTDASQEAIHTIAITIAPRADGSARQWKRDCRQRGPSQTIKDRQELWAC